MTKKEDWVITKSLDDVCAFEYGKEILSTPAVIFTTPEDPDSKQYLYSKKQMIDIFRLGVTMSKTISRREATKLRKRRNMPTPYISLQMMAKGERELFPYEQWASVRTAASTLKKRAGRIFRITKMAPTGKIGDISVVRLE